MTPKKIGTMAAIVLLGWSQAPANAVAPDSLDFEDLKDAMTLDANTSIASAGFSLNFLTTQLLFPGNGVWTSDGKVGIGTTSPDQLLTLGLGGDINLASPGAAIRISGLRVLSNKGNQNMFTGANAGTLITSGFGNVFSGYNAGANNTTGSVNTYIGWEAGSTSTSSNHNTFIGANAGQHNRTANANVFVGRQAGFNNTYGIQNTFVGGFNAGANNTTGSNNTFIGDRAGQANTVGGLNTFLGQTAGFSNSIGLNNTFVGHASGLNSITGSNNVLLGQASDLTSSISYAIGIGFKAKPNASNQLAVGGDVASGITEAFFGKGPFSATPLAFRLNVTAAQGTNIAGANLQVAAGRSTGNASGGKLIFQTSPVGVSGTAQNAPVDRVTITDAGNVGIGTSTPGAKLDINGDSFIVETAKTPSSASDACITGTYAWDTDYLYMCVATNTWKRAALSTW